MIKKLRPFCTIFAIALAWVAPTTLRAQQVWDTSTNSGFQNGDGTWGVDNFWTTTNSGTTLTSWTSNSIAWFGGGGTSTNAATPGGNFTITVSGTQTAASIRQVTSGAGNYTLTGGILSLGDAALRVDQGTLTVNSVLTNTAGSTVFHLNAQTNTTLVIGGDNTFTATPQIRGAAGGTVRLNHTGALGTGSTVQFVNGSVLLDLNGFDFSGKTITVNANQTAFLGNSSATKSVWSGNVTLTNTTAVNLRAGGTNGEVEISGVISGGSGNQVQAFDGGRLRLSGANTYDGVTSVRDNSTLIVGNASALGSTVSGTFINTGATLDLNGFNVGNEAITLQHASSRLVNSNTTTAATIGGGVTLGATSSGTGGIGGEGNLSIVGVVSGAFGFSKIGAGTLTLSASNTYTGTTTVSEGTLALSGSGALGAGTNALAIGGGSVDLGGLSRNVGAFTLGTGTLANGTLTATNYALTNAGSISASLAGSGGLTKTGAGVATLSASNTYSGTTTISAGSLRINDANALGQSTTVQYTATSGLDLNGFSVSGKTISISTGATGFLTNSTASQSTWSGNVQLSGTNAFLRAGGTNAEVEVSGAISGTGGLQTFDFGTLRVSGDNTYSGTTSVREGSTLIVGHSNALGSLSHTNFIGLNATLNLNGFDIGNRIIQFQNNNTRLINDNTTNSAAVSGAITMLTNRTGAQIGGAGNLTLSGNISTQDGTAGGFTKIGAGILILGGSNNYAGTTTLSAGTLRVGNDSALGTGGFTISNNTTFASDSPAARTITNAITMGGNVQLGDATGTGALTLGNVNLGTNTRTLTISNTSTTVAGTITNTGGLTKDGAGTLALAGANSYSGATAVNAGTLTLHNGGGLGSTAAGTTVATGAQVRLVATNSGFTVGAEALTLSGQGVTTGGALRNAAGDNTWQGNITLATNATIGAASGTSLTIDVSSGDAITAANFNLTFDGAGTNRVLDAITLGSGGLTKIGSGITILEASNNFTGATVVTAGVLNLNSSSGASLGSTASVSVANNATLLISQSGQVSDSAAVTLSGGTIQRGAGVSEVFGDLNITTGSFLDFGTGATGNLTFGTYANNATPSALLTLNNFIPGNSLTFSSTSFNAGQMTNYFAFGTGFVDYSLSNTGNTFTITAIPEPSTVIAAIGLLGVILWPSRRRLLKDAKTILGLRPPMRDRLSASRL